jgi:hypothetical protein
MSNQLIAEASTYTPQNEHNRPIAMFSAGFELEISAIGLPQIYTLDITATGMGKFIFTDY